MSIFTFDIVFQLSPVFLFLLVRSILILKAIIHIVESTRFVVPTVAPLRENLKCASHVPEEEIINNH
jgi:hypothetical protein